MQSLFVKTNIIWTQLFLTKTSIFFMQ